MLGYDPGSKPAPDSIRGPGQALRSLVPGTGKRNLRLEASNKIHASGPGLRTKDSHPGAELKIHLYCLWNWGRPGFDVGCETQGACRGAVYLVNPAANLIVANDDNYVLAA